MHEYRKNCVALEVPLTRRSRVAVVDRLMERLTKQTKILRMTVMLQVVTVGWPHSGASEQERAARRGDYMLLLQAGSGGVNPVMPPAWDAMVTIVSVCLAALFVAALVSILRSKNQTPAGTALWVLVALAVPVLGPLLWFIAGRKATQAGRTAGA
ncbi:PLD nuclease N-terminal domain-containing protein [Pseudarthrobacter sp. NPDC058329]|uniref:PLD nuclease N-terminal domain-containing protein n=1 Tax=Pseudarthrobacter sp. NPDC058329 TaxID=3346448 RepID=UPI0036D83535